jgi:iron complex outermembrane receptor protein
MRHAASEERRMTRFDPRPVSLAAALLCMAAAHAAADAEAPAPDTAAASQGLQEVVITAERRTSNVQKTAISITAVTGTEMRAKGQTALGSVLEDTPAVNVQASPQGGQVYVRGVGANGDSNWVDPAVSINLDGVYSGRAERVFSSMFDVSRVEVLRGPQGTLYGRNATGGSVNVLTNNPKLDVFEGGVNGQLGNFDLRHADGHVNLPLGEMFALRLAGMREKRDGYFSNGGRASDLSAGRAKLLFKPGAGFSLLGTVDSFYSNGRGVTTVPRAVDASAPPFVTWPTAYSDPWQVDDLHPADVQRTKFNTYSLQADWDLGFGTLTVLPAYTKSYRYTESDLFVGLATGAMLPLPGSTWQEGQRTVEVRLASPAASPTKWVVGAYRYNASNVQTGLQSTGAVMSTFTTYGTRVPAESTALFGQVTQPLAPTLRLTGGLRYTQDKKTYHYGIRSTANSTVNGYDSGLQSVDASYGALTYKLGLEHDLAPQSMLYAQVATGYKAGGFGTTAIPPQAYEPEKLTALELGSKNRFFDNRLQLNGELYVYRYKNYQVQYASYNAASPVPGDTQTADFFQYVVNAGAGKNLGFELESRWRALPETELRAALTYTRARYGEFSIASLQYLNGTKVANTPDWTVTLGAEHRWALADGTLTAGGQVKFSDGYRATLESNLPGGDLNPTQGSFHRTDLRLGYAPASDRWNAQLWLRNLENKAQITQALPFGRVQVTDPRTVGVNLGLKF